MSREHRYSAVSLGAAALVVAGVCAGCGSSAPGPSGPADAGFGNQPVSHADDSGAGSGPSAAQKRAYETALKSDLQAIATNIATAEVDAPAKIDVKGSGANIAVAGYQDADAMTPTTTYNVILSPGDKLVNAPTVDVNSGQYCVALAHSLPTGDVVWHIESTGAVDRLNPGPCT